MNNFDELFIKMAREVVCNPIHEDGGNTTFYEHSKGNGLLNRIYRLFSRKNNHNIFVAMKFGKDTKSLREAIRLGINLSGFKAIFIDEIEHIGYIPDMIRRIIDSCRAIVVDLSHNNSGAYYEEGFADGRNIPVIQLCKKGVEMHFDVSQRNTLIWEDVSDIPNKLKNRLTQVLV